MSTCPPVRRSFSEERGTGTFHTLGVLPKRKHDIPARKSPVFHIPHDDDDGHSSSVDEHCPSPCLSVTTPATVPFPRSTSPPTSSSPSSSSTSRPTSPGPQLPRGTSTPILLSSGKPLKPSLKLSSSSPTILNPPQAQRMHLRARSEPSTPVVTPKNVHFPEKDYALATVRVFNRSARPAALSSPENGNGDETETEGEEPPPTRFPFPPVFNYEIDPTKSSPVPYKISPLANLLLESLDLPHSSPSTTAKPLLTGSILVRNLSFEKHVAIRFTLDDWQTVSEVGAHYVDSLSVLPSQILLSPSASTSEDLNPHRVRGWDRFAFTIRLEDYAHSLTTRTLWLAARYRISSTYPEPGSTKCGPGGEWWDNNDNSNYRVGFRPVVAATSPRNRPRRETFSASIPSPCTQPQPALTCKKHATGLIVPPVPNNKEIQPVNETDGLAMPLRAGKLSLRNYAPPTIRTRSSHFPATNPDSPPSTTLRSPSDEDTSSPASSTLSTPSVSPTIAPRVMINGHPATPTHPHDSNETEEFTSRPGHIADWGWSALSKPRTEELHCQHTNLSPVSELPERRRDIPSPPGRRALADSNSLYDTFVMQWCFARGPSPNYNGYDGGGIVA